MGKRKVRRPWEFEQDAGGGSHYAVWRRKDGLLLGFIEYDSEPHGTSVPWLATSPNGRQESWHKTRSAGARTLYLDQQDRDRL